MSVTPMGNPVLFDRSEIKAALMQAGYGQREAGTKNQLEEDLGSKYNDEIFDVFVQAVDEVVPGFYRIMNFVNELWNKDWENVSFTMPDGHVVVVKPTSSVWADFTLFDQLQIKAKVGGVSKEKKALILYVSIIHAVDAWIAREVIRRADFDIITIHDAFRCHMNNADRMQEIYTEVLAELNEMRLLEDILEEVLHTTVETIQGDLESSDILETKYAIC